MAKTTPKLFAKKLKLSDRLATQARFRELSSSEARAELGFGTSVKGNSRDLSGIAIEGYDLMGEARGVYQVRRHNPERDEKGREKDKYMSRPKSAGERWINTTPGGLKDSEHIIVVESPKSTWAVTGWLERLGKKRFRVVDIQGLDGWRVRESDEPDAESHPNPDLLLLAGHKVTLIPDSNALVREDLRPKVEALETFLEGAGCELDGVVKIPAEPDVNGPDDFIAAKDGDRKLWQAFERRQPLWHFECPAVSDFAGEEIKADLLVPHLLGYKTLTVFASPSENYKTMIAMVLSKSILTGDRVFESDNFPVLKTVPGVLYMVPDMSHELAVTYARKFDLDKGDCVGKFRIRTMKQGDVLPPDHPIVIRAAKAGWLVVLDTVNYFTDADDDNNPQQFNKFVKKVRKLVDVHGASGVLMLAHPTKTGANSSEINLTEWVSGTYGKIGSVDAIFCMKKIVDDGGMPLAVYVSREKSRPFMGVRLEPFTLALLDGKGSTIDRGCLPIGQLKAGALKDHLPKKDRGGAPSHPLKAEMMKFIRGYLKNNAGKKDKLTRIEVWRALNACKDFNRDGQGRDIPSEKTIGNWLKELREDKKNVAEILNEEAA